MNCPQNEAFELGSLEEKVYRNHVKDCIICQEIIRRDQKLLELARDLDEPTPAPGLWHAIETALMEEKTRPRRSYGRYSLWAVAAVLIIALGVGIYVTGETGGDEEQRLLTKTLLKRVVETEKSYEQAITQLEAAAEGQLLTMDTDLMLLYRDRLETIDAQIERCRAALRDNPANSHIRRYLLTALQDKQETLTELLAQQPTELL